MKFKNLLAAMVVCAVALVAAGCGAVGAVPAGGSTAPAPPAPPLTPPATPAAPAATSTTVMSAEERGDGQEKLSQRQRIAKAKPSVVRLQGKSGGYGYGVRFPLNDLAPGTYVIRVQGRNLATAPEAPLARDVLIRVR